MADLSEAVAGYFCILLMMCCVTYQNLKNLIILCIYHHISILEALSILRVKENDSSQIFFDYFEIVEYMSDRQFYEDFRMPKGHFQLLHAKLATTEYFQSSSNGKPPVNSEKCLCIGLWVLATPDSYRSIARRFAVSKSTVVTCLSRVVKALCMEVCPHAIRLPKSERERKLISDEFENICGMRDVLGAIDGCHIDIPAPARNDKITFFDRKKNYSVLMQGLCDADCMFLNVDIRWPGSVHDSTAFRTSDLYQVCEEVCSNKYCFIGDAAYPLSNFLMRPFRKTYCSNARQRLFNKVLSKTRQVVERAFGQLKNKFRRLYFLHRMKIEETGPTILACCILHNICLASEDYAEKLIFGCDDDPEGDEVVPVDNIQLNPKEKRQIICDYIWNLYH